MKVNKTISPDQVFMQRCLELAGNGLGYVAPNPMVGAVVVHKGEVIGEGYHRQFGQAHAEVNAIQSVKDKSLLQGSTLYVNLEPCVHTGKTPPCTDLILANAIPNVVIGTPDPNPLVQGKGIEKLIKNGVQVTTGILDDACRNLNKRFFTFHTQKRPYIILKWAQTKDGFIDIKRKPGESIGVNWITSPLSRNIVHKWRSEEQGIMAGTRTVIMDNPHLNVRNWEGHNPIRIVLDRSLGIPGNYYVLDNNQPTLIFNEKKSEKQGNTEFIKMDFSDRDLTPLFRELYKRNFLSVFVEGGKELHEYLIENNLWDEARVFIGNKFFNDGIKAPEIAYLPEFQKNILTDSLIIYKNPNSNNL